MVDIGPAKCQLVLAALALSAGEAISLSRLIDLVWVDEPPRTAGRTLQSYVARLRKRLGPESIVRSGSAYRLAVDRDSVDVGRFQRCLELGDTDAALAEWTGTPLAGLDPAGLAPVVYGLVEQWLSATEDCLSRQLEADATSTIGRLTELTAEYPFREGLWELLMLALYRSGRQADALAAFSSARSHLVEAIGVEPGPRLREIEALILDHDERLPVVQHLGDRAEPPSGTVTFSFSDVERSTQLWAKNRHAMATAMARHDELVREAIRRRRGYLFATGGDSFGVAFNRAADAVAWADDVQTAIGREPWRDDLVLKVRIGLHTGEAEERGGDYFGPPVNVAARIASIGHGGQTLASAVTGAVAGDIEALDLGTFRLKDVVAPVRIVQLDAGDHAPPRTDQEREGNLPGRAGRLFGRHRELDLVKAALSTSPLVTLVGPGGIGKTRLAVAAAQQAALDLHNGAWVVELAETTSATDVPRLFAEVLNIKESPGQSLTSSIVAGLAARECMVVLDNCEHVVAAAGAVAQAVIDGCPDVRLLATSREALGLGREQLVAVTPLDPEGAAAELFADRARALDPEFDLDNHRSEVEQICQRLDGVPLAIELAAARSRALSPTDLLERLDDHLRLLSGGRRVGVERHRTLRATIQWSYDLLTGPQQVLFQRLTVFAGTFDLNAAEVVTSDGDLLPADVDDLVAELVERSMILVESGLAGRRFRLLETMRQFGDERLFENGETSWITERHARWCSQELTDTGQLLTGMREIEGVAQLDELWPNLRAAFDWACTNEHLELATSLLRPVSMEVFFRSRSEVGDWAERLLTISSPKEPEVIIELLATAGTRYIRNRDTGAFAALVERCGNADDPRIAFVIAQLADDHEGVARLAPQAA
ncbi:MAG: AfsR/SARP family transcriptional regulator, partial [Acidimicrobiales bacterium]